MHMQLDLRFPTNDTISDIISRSVPPLSSMLLFPGVLSSLSDFEQAYSEPIMDPSAGEQEMDVSEAIRLKRAVRTYSPKPVSDEAVTQILNAGRRAQSSKNTQPWHFVAIRDRQILEDLAKLGTYTDHLAHAPLGIAIITPDPAQRWSIMFDAGQAAAYMQLAAWELGIGSCIATIHNPEPARPLLGFPKDMHLRVALSFGYSDDPKLMNVEPHKGGRRSIKDVVHYDRWKG
jgi:nitroreductase